MDDSAVADFIGITDAAPHVAQYFLNLTNYDMGQAVGLFFESPHLIADIPRESQPTASSAPSGAPGIAGRTDERGVVHLDSDEEANEPMEEDIESDEALARRLQEEMYEGGDMSGRVDADGVRAPNNVRVTETLVGPGADWGPDDLQEAAIQQQLARIRARQQAGPSRGGRGGGVFSQQPVPIDRSIWNDGDPEVHRNVLAQATGGASESSSRSARLAEMYRAPYEIMNSISWDDAKEQGKEEEKWIIVNVQDNSVFDCQMLNRDIWKHDGIKETIRENFIFMQYDKNDPAGSQYIRFYFQRKDDIDAYPHIAIIDPRTGEQVKVWSGPPCPKPYDFLMQLHDFLDRYSLKVDAKNPVAKRKPEKQATLDVNRMTEEEMLEHAIQSSLQNGNGEAAPKEDDPDELTKSVGDLGKGKERATEDESMELDAPSNGNGSTSASPFSLISSSNPHVEPANEKNVTTRIQFRHSNGRVIRLFRLDDPIRRIYEWLKAEPLEGKEGQVFELKFNGQDLLDRLSESVQEVGLGGATVMIEYIEE